MDIEILDVANKVVNMIVLPLLSALLFYSIKKRQAEAKARQAEAEAKKSEADNITSYAAEWKELYEKKETRVHELDNKIDSMYVEKEKDRQHIRELMDENQKLKLDKQALEFKKCEVKGCGNRKPQSGY